MEYHFPKALEETNNNEIKIRQAFGMDNKKSRKYFRIKRAEQLFYRRKNTIQDIEKSAWNQYMGKQNIFDWDGMVYLEKTFSQHPDQPTNGIFTIIPLKTTKVS
jgi:hypothetical protein